MIEINKIKSPFIYYCQKVIPLAFDESLSYYEQLCHLTAKIKEVIEEQNIEGDAIEELQQKYLLLVDYVDHYFDNLDVQEEINNKLDEMAEGGELENIIAQYIGLQSTYTYNNVSEMKLSENLSNGAFVRTSGFYSYNDGGGAFYKVRTITSGDVIDEMFIIALYDENLIAEYIPQNDSYNINALGCKGDHTFDNTTKLQAIINKAETTGYKILIPNGEYLISDTLYINNKISIEGLGDNRLWKGTSKHPMICGYITDKPFIFISDQSTLYNWDTAKNHLVESVHLKNLRLVGSTQSGFSLTGIFASCYLSTFENLTINGFYNDIAFAGCYETIVNDCRFTQSYQNLVLFDNNRTTVFNNVYCNGGQHDTGSVINNADYIAKYNKNHMLNYCCVYANISYHYFYNLAVEDSCYGIISRDSDITSNVTNFESLSDYCIETSINLKTNVYTNIDNAHFYNPNTSAFNSCKLFKTGFRTRLNLKTVDPLPITAFNNGDIGSRSIARLYSYITGEKIIPLTLSSNVDGATIINKSHYTQNGFKVDFEFSGQTSWGGSSVTTITGLPTTPDEIASKYRYFACPNKTKDTLINLRVSGTGIIVDGSGAWIGGSSYLNTIAKINYEYDIN